MFKRIILCGAVLALGTSLARAGDVSVGDQAPEIKAAKWYNAKGEVSLEKLKGQVVCVEFWATWCGPCKRVHPKLVSLHKELNKKGFVLVSMSNEPSDKVGPFLASHSTPYIIGAGSETGNDYGVTGIPAAFVLDTSGKVVWKGNPLSDEFEKAVRDQLKKTPPTKIGGLAEEDANELLATAEGQYKKKDYSKAMKSFELAAKEYPDTAAGKTAKKRLAEMKKDKKIVKAVREADAKKKCTSWLQMARDLKKNGKADSARKYYQRIIDEFGDTSYAETARAELAELG